MLDRFIGWISPAAGVRRLAARATMAQINAVVGGNAGYNAGKINRFNRERLHASVKEHALPVRQFGQLVAESWDAYRNNSYVRKIVSSLTSKVVGRGMQPESLAVNSDGSPNVAFRARAKQLWNQVQSGFDVRGLPSKGGLTFSDIQRLAFRSTVLTGEVLYRLVPIEASDAISREIPVPTCIQLIDASRLAEEYDVERTKIGEGNYIYRGIELDVKGRRVAYWINAIRPGSTNPDFAKAKRYPVSEVGHLFIEDDIDQYRGTSWLAPVIDGLRDTGDLQYNVLKASAYAACFVGSYAKPTGATRFGLAGSGQTNPDTADGSDLTDADGNAVTRIQPGLLINTGKDGQFQLHSPNQPNLNPEAFVQHMLRGISAGLPGVKPSTVHGDYRASSFSSERSADNDTWPEIESLQSWFSAGFLQPVWEAVIREAVLYGVFDDVLNIGEFQQSPHLFTATRWQGPVSRSINPLQDVEAAAERMRVGLSSLQMECAQQNVNWLDVLDQTAELYQTAEAKGLPPEVVNNILGVGSDDVIAQTNKQTAEQNTGDPADAIA